MMILFAIATGMLAASKGHSAALWGLLGFVLPLFAILAVLVMRERRY